jgi:5-hydroxyisourate hydrolase
VIGLLTTHVLDTARGLPASGVLVEAHLLRGSERTPVGSATTNAQGRTDTPLAGGSRFESGVYELTFHIGEYFRRTGVTTSDPPFLDRVVIRVGIADPSAGYHIPLLISPFCYTTYRGT